MVGAEARIRELEGLIETTGVPGLIVLTDNAPDEDSACVGFVTSDASGGERQL